MSVYNPDLPRVTLESLHESIGSQVGVSRWFEISQSRIDAFADVTEDRQYIHVDPAAAAETPFGGAVAHGFLTLSMLSAMAYDAVPRVEGVAMGVNYGFEKVRFVSPVRAGARIRGKFELMAVTRRSDTEWQVRHAVEVEIDGGGKPALVADWLSMIVLG